MIEELLAKTEKGTSIAHGVCWTSCVRAVSSWMLSGACACFVRVCVQVRRAAT